MISKEKVMNSLYRTIVVTFIIASTSGLITAQQVTLQEQKDAWVCSCAPNANNYGVYPKVVSRCLW